MSKKRTHLALGLGLLVLAFAGAEQLTTVAVFNLERVQLDYYQDSALFQEYLDARQEYRDQLARFEANLQDFQTRRANALDRNDARTAQRLREDIEAIEADILAIRERWLAQEPALREALQGDDFVIALYDVVEFVAEDNGFTIVLEETLLGDGLFWYNPEVVDITEEIVAELLRRGR